MPIKYRLDRFYNRMACEENLRLWEQDDHSYIADESIELREEKRLRREKLALFFRERLDRLVRLATISHEKESTSALSLFGVGKILWSRRNHPETVRGLSVRTILRVAATNSH